jgi:hypothetical protein
MTVAGDTDGAIGTLAQLPAGWVRSHNDPDSSRPPNLLTPHFKWCDTSKNNEGMCPRAAGLTSRGADEQG